MRTFFKRYLKYILLAAAFVAVLCIIGAFTLQDVAETEARKSSYTRTEFDFFISSPDSKQAESIENDPSVGALFPYCALSNAFAESAAAEVFLLLSDDMQDASISLFGEKLLVEGEFDENGAMLDLLAAEKLGVSVGDTVSFTILGNTFERTVSGVYLTSTYGVLTEGIVLVGFSADIAAVYSPRTYSGAFLTADNEEGVRELLKDYVGEGNVALSFEEYVEINCGTKPPYQSQEEYDAQCEQMYAEYREDILAAALRGGGQAVAKADSYRLVEDSVRSVEKRIQSTEWLAALSAFVLFIVLQIIFIVANRRDDRVRCGEGMKMSRMAGGYVLTISVSAVIIAVLTCGILSIAAALTFFMGDCMGAAVFFFLPVLIAVPVLGIFVWFYVRHFYSHAV